MEWSLKYRPVWLLNNLILILLVLLGWGYMSSTHIKIDIPNIETKSKETVAPGAKGEKIRANFGYKAGGMDFCAWATSDHINLTAPFDAVDCSKKDQFTLEHFGTTNVTTDLQTYPNMNIWEIYQKSELFDAINTEMKKPANDYLKMHLANDGIYTGPKTCIKYLDKMHESQRLFAIFIFIFLLAHIVHVVVYNKSDWKEFRNAVDIGVTCLYFILYAYAIVMFITQQDSKVFTECSWLSKSFQQDQTWLYLVTWAYLILGIAGLIGIGFFIYERVYVAAGSEDRALGRYGMLLGVPGGYVPSSLEAGNS
tara:strand:+ start:741 stop:1670 length:930 start_codon:yes stop_codon:yes gene_type:complete